ncbi:hydrocephalus-inducing protein-like [Maniola hyperantus]|uniref:hydrocephalus-inducing protein-like n=1 Tax=Aphantopus hyperantus TaxID=2795564 RepID=UPI00374788C2
MEILHKFKQNGYFTADLYHLLATKKLVDPSEEIIPSEYEREMKMTTMERIRCLNSIVVDNIVHSGKPSKVVLSFTPRVIVFQNFKPNDKLVAKFSVKNTSKSPAFLNMVYKESSYFFIKPVSGQLLSRLAPGISVSFAVTFQPVQYEDYTHRVTFYTDIDQYVLPLIAMGPRPVFDFPDQIDIPRTPLKIENELFLAIHNVGMVPAGFTLNAKCPFSVQPKSAYLNPNQKIDIRVGFKTMHLGDKQGIMNATFETGENFRIKLTGSTYTVSIELEKQVVRFLDTYNTMVRQQTFKITNKSNHTLTYMCMKNDCIYYDFEDKVKLATVFYDLKQTESAKSNKLVYYDVLSSEEHLRVYTRIFCDEIQALVADDSLVFQNKHISVTPIKGTLWPNKATELTIIFAPKEIGEFEATVYLDVDGVNDRLPLKIVGTSLPPLINLNLETLDMDNVYINNIYNYEIVATNKGHINGIIEYKHLAPLFGSIISCTPESYFMRPGEKQIFRISFCNSNQGPFFEELNFTIRETNVVLKLYLKGVVIYPSLMFSKPCLNFGNVSLGVPKTMELEVINESQVNVDANVTISSDGPEMRSIILQDYAVADKPKPQVPQWPREFDIEPYKINIGRESTVSLRVTLTANLIRANQTYMELEIDQSDSPPIVLPVTFNAMVPLITPAPDIMLRACFTDYPYMQEVNVVCKDFWGYFTLEEPEEESKLEVVVGIKEGLIEPNSTLTLPVTIKTSVLGIEEYTIRMYLFGMSKPVEVCHITGCGMRPIVTCTPFALHWGQVKLLTKSHKILTLCNDSPVDIYFRASLLNRDGRWHINPMEGHLEPESETELNVSLYLIDADSYTNKAIIQLEKVKDILVPLSATGIGTSILVGEDRDKIMLGRHFTKIPLNFNCVMKNCGTRLHILEWSEHYKAPKTKQHTTAFFNMEPRTFKMSAGEKMELNITGLSYKVATVKEMWYLIGSVEGINKKELLLECQVVAEFVDPKIELSSSIVNFQYDYGPYREFYKLTDLVTIKNVSKLPLDFEISVKPPFAILQKQSSYKVSHADEMLCGCVCYNERDLNIPTIIHENGQRRSKVFIDYLTLKPVEPLKKEPLHFFEDIHKIKWAFNLTHLVEERLEDQEIMKIQILFDTTKHTTLKSRVYCDLMRLRFKGHKNKDAIKLIGKINFPNIIVLTPRLDFTCILNGSIESNTIKIQNVTPLLACFRFNWRKCIVTKSPMAQREVLKNNESSKDFFKYSTATTPASEGAELREILACRTPVGSPVGISGDNRDPTPMKESPITSIANYLRIEDENNFEVKKYRVMMKISPMIDKDHDNEFEWIHKFVKLRKRYDIAIHDVLEVVPHCGVLKPNEVQYVNVIFRSKINVNVRATLECEVLGGPPETVMITGQSSDLLYTLNTQKINFKIRSFHENATEVLMISNIAQLSFEYKTYLNEPTFENDLYGTILGLIPTAKVLEPEEQAALQVEVRPGVKGHFQTTFILEIGHLPFVSIEVIGWGVIPQVYICLPRPVLLQLDPKLGYRAIPILTPGYLEAINEIFTSTVSEHLNTPITEKCFEDRHFQQDWHICSSSDAYPSTMDIELAIERMLVTDHITSQPEIVNSYQTTSKSGSIPGFITIPYVIDYGVVITGSTIQCSVEIINYGPIVTKLHFAKGTQIPSWLTVKLCGKLNPGESGKLEVTFAPTSLVFTEPEQNVETSFNIEVPYGVSIPINMKALCAVPYLASNVSEINFGSVRCGDKIMCTIPLKNVGKPTCIWFVTLRLKTPGTQALILHNSSGKYDPGEGGLISISFKPTMEMLYEGLLVFKFHMNPNKLTIPVIGQGIVPHVHIIGPNVTFPPTLPWAKTTEIYFGLTNPCPFPIELIIAHSDKKWKEENEIYQLLDKYYSNPNEMLVPAIKPGAGMPVEIINFYEKFSEKVKKKTKSPKNVPKVKDTVSPKIRRSETEIIADVIVEMKAAKIDPLLECLHVFDTKSTDNNETDTHSKGLIILVHGSSCEEIQCQEMACSMEKALGLPRVSIDSCIVDALCVCNCAAKSAIISIVDELYETAQKYVTKENENADEKEYEAVSEMDDTFDAILKKIQFLSNHMNVGTPRSKVGDKKKKKSPPSSAISSYTAIGSATMFQMDLILELLTEYFKLPKFDKGFVVDTLTSIVIKSPQAVLTTIIKSKHTIWNIHLLLCYSDFNKCARTYEDLQKEADLVDENISKVYDEKEIQNIVQSLNTMESEEYENASAELKAIYVTFGLEERRRRHYEKVGFPKIKDSVKEKNSKDPYSKSIITDDNESRKKIKKEDLKGKPTRSENVMMNTKYNDYKQAYERLLNIANNWIIEKSELGTPLYDFTGHIINSAQKKSKKKSDMQIQNSEASFTQRGFPLTIISCPYVKYKKELLKMFTESNLVREALKEEEKFDILKKTSNKNVYTVLLPKTFPTITHEEPLQWCYLDEPPIKKCECNQLNDLSMLDDTNQENVLDILSKWHCTCGKKVTSSQTSTSEIPSNSVEKIAAEASEANVTYPLPLRTVKSFLEHSGRIVLQPGDLVRCKYAFSPQYEGNFNVKRFVEVSGWPDSRTDIIVTGICGLPRLDSRPKKIFENFARRTVKDKVYKVTYLDDQKFFEFGPIFIGSYRIYEEKYVMDLRNSSLITTDIVIEFLDDTLVFQIDKTFVRLEPGCRGKMSISAAPTEVGVHMSNLLFCVKDNPEIVTVTLACSGVVPIVEILPLTKMIEYGKHLLYRKEDDRFIVKNDSILPIKWKIRNANDFVEDFIIAETTGVVPRNDNQVVLVTYLACRVGVILNKPLIIEIYDAEGRGNPMVIDSLYLSAECYDVMVECAYENPFDNCLNYGNVKVNSTVVKELYMLNRGRYNVFYKLKKVKNFPEPSLLRSFSAIPECGILPPTIKLITTEFECTPTTLMNLVNVPAYICSLLDGSKNQVVVAKFPVCVTIASFYNTFTLFPLGELNFHIIPVGVGVTREVILNNTSKCPFTYTIVLPPKYQIDPDDPQPQTKLKDNKLKNPPLRCGNFLILNDDNLLAPGTSRTLQIQFLATAARRFEETIHFIISDTCPAESEGVPLKLVGTGAIPTLDFWNIENTFREHLIVKNLTEYAKPESSTHCVFVEDSVTLHFFSVTVNSKFVAVIDLYNSGLVASALTMKLHYQANSNHDIFSLDKYETHIEPLLHKNLGIVFTPKALQEYRAVLEIRLKSLQNQEQSFKICLIGEGVIPRISMVSPPIKHQRMGVLRFPVTCLGSISVKEIRFKNVSSVQALVIVKVFFSPSQERPVFWLTTDPDSDQMIMHGKKEESNKTMKIMVKPGEIATVYVNYNPIRKGRTSCDVQVTISKNPYEFFSVLCEAEAFMEDVILTGLDMLSMDVDIDAYKKSAEGTVSTVSTVDSRKKSKSATVDKKKSKHLEGKKSKRISHGSVKLSDGGSTVEHSVLKYILNFGGCELCVMHKRSVTMVNNSEKVYMFQWETVQHLLIKPSVGYISPGEEKDIEITFFCAQLVAIKKELLNLNLKAICDDFMTLDLKATTWDNRQTVTVFDHNRDVNVDERYETVINEQINANPEITTDIIHMVVIYSAVTEYSKYVCNLEKKMNLKETFIYQVRDFSFKVENTGKVPLKIMWDFIIDVEYPARIDKFSTDRKDPIDEQSVCYEGESVTDTETKKTIDTQPLPNPCEHEQSKITLFSGSPGRESVDTWFEADLPFVIEPEKDCLKPNESRKFKVTFAPLEAFIFNVKLRSNIDNLGPYDQNISCEIKAKSLVPYVHLDVEESDYLTSGRRKVIGMALPEHTTVLEFNVLGSGCYKKTFDVINPTSDGYEFMFEMVLSDKPELIPMHCNMLKGYVEGGASTKVVFTFSPTAPGVYESQWKFIIPDHCLVMNLLAVGIVREPIVNFVPTILIIRNSLVGFTTNNEVILRNNESECLNFEFKGNSICNESGKTPVIVEPEQGVLKPKSDTPIKIIYTPIQDGPLSFKIFCSVTYLTKLITLCVNALSHSIKPKITYYLFGNDHTLNSDAITNIHLDQTASTYERTIPFVIKNDGSATFFIDWHYDTSEVKKYLQLYVEPKSGHVTPANEIECVLHFTLKKVPVQAFPVTLSISDGPEYNIHLHAEIEKPQYSFSCKEYDFGRCIVNAPDSTYKKNLAFENEDKVPVTLEINFSNLPELYVVFNQDCTIDASKRLKIPIFFRPKRVKEYEFKLQFWVNSLCEEIITIKGEGVPLLFDLYEGCQKSFNLGPVKVGEKVVRPIEVMNHSKVPIEATFIFKVMYQNVEDNADVKSEGTSACLSPGSATTVVSHAKEQGPSRVDVLHKYKKDKIQEQIDKDSENALSSLKVIPNKCTIKPYMKVPVKIQFKPVGLISNLDVQLNMKVFEFERPLVRLSGSATGMSLRFSQNSLQFGRVRRRACKILKVMLFNEGDFGARFWWQPLLSNEFKISPMQGNIAAHTNVTFTVTFRPINHNPFIKVWASCNIENYPPLELALYATCIDTGNVQSKTLFMECPVRDVDTQYVVVTNPSDEMWLVLSEVSGGPFETLKEFYVEPNSTFDIPIHFKPKTMGKHEGQVLFSPLGEAALFISLVGEAMHPNPNGTINITVPAKEFHTVDLPLYNITEFPESYVVITEVLRTVPDKFEGYYEINHPQNIKVWGGATVPCRWKFVCYEVCEMHLRVIFVNDVTREYQYYVMVVHVTASKIVDTLIFTSKARESVQREIKIVNPLATEALFNIKCDTLACPQSLKISRKSEAFLALVYSPLVVGEQHDSLELSNQLVGTYLYDVKMKCLPAKPKKLEFTTVLGSCVPLRLRVQNNTDVRANFVATVSHPSIKTEPEYILGPFEKGKFQAWFEPTELGVQNCRVSFDSPVAGEFVFSIKGTAKRPTPQGPFDIKVGGSITIKFKNVFVDSRMFKISIDREEFYTKSLYESVSPKKELKVVVYLTDLVHPSSLPTGCLTIENYEPPEPKVHWTYFLKGVP